MKKVSLILTTYNSSENLEKTLESIEQQDYLNIEVVIKDGGSTDQTLDIIKHYQEQSKYNVVWNSQKDCGIYDAMNQGYAMSSGDIIAFFNDVFAENGAVSNYGWFETAPCFCGGMRASRPTVQSKSKQYFQNQT